VERLLDNFSSFDCFYIHIKGPDEPGHDGDFKLKTQIIEAIDAFFFERLLQKLDLEECIVCVTADHATPCKLKAHSDDPVPLLISGDRVPSDGAEMFSEKECKRGSLGTLECGTLLMPMLMMILKGDRSRNYRHCKSRD